MKKIGLFLIVAISLVFVSCKKDDPTSEYDKGYEQGVKSLEYTSLIYNEETASFSVPDFSVENTIKILGLTTLYTTYTENSANAEWKAGFKAGAATGAFGDEGATKLITFFDDSATATLISALYTTATSVY